MQIKSQRAIILGGSIAGLLAARVLAEHFQEVIVIERDALPVGAETRKGAPHAQHQHALLARGYEVMQRLFPGLQADLIATGALIKDISADVRWYQGGYSLSFDSGVPAVFASRPALEGILRNRVQAIDNVKIFQECAAHSLLTTPDQRRITGVRIDDRRAKKILEVKANLVVDATGRGSPMPKWLAALGYATPEEEVVNVGVTYTTRLYHRTASNEQALAFFCAPAGPQERRGGGVFPIEGNRWIVTLSGRRGEQAPADEEGFLAYAASLPSQDIYHLLSMEEPAGDILVYKYPASRRRHYETLKRLPAGLVAIGDAVCSFNPVYGQGMTVCALEAEALASWWQEATARSQEPDTVRFFQKIAQLLKTPWKLSTDAEKEHLPTPEQRTFPAKWLRSYFLRLRQASRHDAVVALAFIRVTQLLAPPASLFHPRVVAGVLFGSRTQRRAILASSLRWRTQVA